MKRSLELRQERSALYDQAQALVPAKGSMTPEVREKFDRMMADMDLMKADIDRLEKAEALGEEMRAGLPLQTSAKPGAYNDTGNGIDPKAAEEEQRRYRKAFGNYLRRGMNGIAPEDLNVLRSQGRSAEYRDQDNTAGPGGGFLIPTGFQQELEVALKQFGGVRQACRTLTTATGNQLPWPTTNDTGVMGRRLGANAVTTPATVQNQTFGQVSFGAWTYTSDVIRIPNELINDSAFDLEGEVRDRFSERIGRIQNAEFTNLTPSSNGPTGFIPAAYTAVTGAAGETTSCTYNDVIDLQHGIDPAYRRGAAYMFNDQTLRILREIKDNYGRPLFGPGLNGADPDTIAGYPFVINQDMPVMAASAKSMAFGIWSKYVIRDVQNSAVVVRLSELYALQNETAFVSFLRSDGQLLDAGTHPIALFQNAAA